MPSICKLLICLCLLSIPVTITGQERIRNTIVGPYGDETRVVIALTDPLPEGYRLQSMIIDLTPIRKKTDEPSLVQLDLTSTIRAVTTGEKQQKILILRWKKNGELEVKCEGKWTRQEGGPAMEGIVIITKAVIQTLPTDVKRPTEFTLAPDLEKRISSIFDSLSTEKFQCLRDLH